MKKVTLVIATALLTACGDDDGANQVGNTKKTAVAACTERGVQYFKDIGSYPTLSSAANKGRKAEDVALERCRRTTTAF